MKAAQAMVQCLEQEGITTVYGYPGAAICPFYDALEQSGIRHILVRQEQMAGHAASGAARMTNRPQVAIATSGPGALNLLPAVATAYADSVPLVVITGQVYTSQIGRDVFQEADVTGAVEPFVKHSYLVRDASRLPQIMKEAFYLAGTGRKGPVLIDVPQDVQEAEIDFSYPDSVDIRAYKPTEEGNHLQVKRAAEALSQAAKPLICVGGGVFSAGAEKPLLELARRLEIPVVSTMMGLSAIPDGDPLFFGMIGMHGVQSANYAVSNCDVLLLVGGRMGDRSVKSPGFLAGSTKIIHIDVDPAEIGKNVNTSLPIVGDARRIVEQLLARPELASLTHSEWLEELRATRRPLLFKESPKGTLNPKEFLHLLSRHLPEDSICVADVGQNQIWACNHLPVGQGRFMTCGGMGTMGYSLPAAEGAKCACPGREVIAICGDGAFQMCFQELGTLCQHDIPVKIVLFNNHYLGMVRELQTKAYGDRRAAVSLEGSPDFTALAQSYGIPAERLESLDHAEEALERMLSARTPYLLECMVDPLEPTLP